jgi:predicted transcriptional regulator
MTERTTVRLPEELMRRAKRKAAAEGRTLTSLIEDGLRHMVSEERKAAKQKRVMPRVSKAKGGLLPGIDITKFSDIQGMDDLEYVERLKSGFK